MVVVTYSSISTNGFEPYGECVMGMRGTMIVEKEQKVMLYPRRTRQDGDAGRCRSASPRRRDGRRRPGTSSTSAARSGGRPGDGRRAGGAGRPGQPRLPRGDGALRLLHPHVGPEAATRRTTRRQVRPRCRAATARSPWPTRSSP